MRLRSSQFVFLLLLVCSVQIREEYASQLMADAIAGRTTLASQRNEASTAPAEPIDRLNLHRARPAQTLRLDPSALAAHRVAWTVRRPLRESAAVVSFTGFLRA
jgi:hypothetical protein